MTAAMSSPSPKRIKLESSPSPSLEHQDDLDINAVEEAADVEQCSICLQPMADRTLIPICSHEFCFECLLIWTDQSRRCPLCSQAIGDYLIHHIRSKYDFQKHYLTPLPTSPKPHPLPPSTSNRGRRPGSRREIEWGRGTRRDRQRELEAVDALERAIEKRKWIYRYRLYAKHVASNPYTRYKPFPTPAQFSASPDLISRATIFIRRELRVWGCLDVEFLTTFIISILKSLDIRSESAIKLLSEFLDLDTGHELQVRSDGPRANAEHFAHELYCYLRSPYRDLSVYDTVVQYDAPEGVPQLSQASTNSRWLSQSPSSRRPRSQSRSRSHTRPGPSETDDHYILSRHEELRQKGSRFRGRRTRESKQPHVSAALTDPSNESCADSKARPKSPRRDTKGKGRAVDDSDAMEASDYRGHFEGKLPRETSDLNVIQPNTSDQTHAQPGEVPSSTAAAEISENSTTSHVPTSYRHRNVWDEMHSHLSKAADARNAAKPTTQPRDPLVDRQRQQGGLERPNNPVATRPSLLDRLSDPSPSAVSYEDTGSEMTSHDRDYVDRVNASGHMLQQESRSSTDPVSESVPHSNTQPSKIRRASVSQWLNGGNQRGTKDIPQKQSSRVIDDVSAIGSSSSFVSTASSRPVSTTTVPAPADDTQSSSSSLRAKLMNKLESERQLQDRSVPDPNTNSVNEGTPPQPSQPNKITSSHASSHSDGLMREAKLRSQAQLRVRLAMEKKAIDNSGYQLQFLSKVTEVESSLEASERELRLKAQLWRARAQ